MSLIDPELKDAEVKSEAARKQLAATLVEIQARLNPRALAREAAQELKDTGEQLAREGIDALKRHPVSVAGAATAVGLFLARRPLRRLLSAADDETPPAAVSLTDSTAPARRTARKKGKQP